MNGFMLDSKDLFHKCESYRKNEKERDIRAGGKRGQEGSSRKVQRAVPNICSGLSRRTQI